MKALETLKRTLRDLTLPQQVGMGAAAIVVLIAAAAFLTWVSQPSYAVLYSNIDQAQLSEVIDSLDAAGVPYRLEGGGSRVMVPQSSVYQVRASLAGDGIQGSVVPQGYELLDEQGLSVSDFRQRVDYQRALEGELSRTLSAMNGVASATVHLVIPEEALFIENQEPVTASVLIDPRGTLSESDIEAVVMLVSSSVEGLEPGQVTVASTDGLVLHAAGEDSFTAMGSQQLRMTTEFESAMTANVNTMLTSLLGPGRASVVVRAELDFDERSTETENIDPATATPLNSSETVETLTSDGGAGAAAGTIGVDGAPLPAGDGVVDYNLEETITEFAIDRTVVRVTEAPGAIERLSVAVVVDDGTLTGLAAPDLAALNALVTAAVGAVENRGDTVEVSALAFPAPAEIEPVEEETGGGIMSMLPTIIGALVLLLVTVGLFLMTRSGKKSKKGKKGEVVDMPEALMAGQVLDADALAQANAVHGLTDDVIQLVERQPEEIATLLRSWLADRRETA
ncbi:MAG: flagellar basal-body MS-ring/collar protein FliF [Acidimicrobiia bacterium]